VICKRKDVATALFILFLGGCATATMGSLSQSEKDAIQIARFKASYNTTFSVVLEVIEEAGYFIANADKDIGLITTEWKEGALSFEEELFFGSGVRRKMSANLKKVDDNTTEVKLRGIAQTKSFGSWSGTENDMGVDNAKKSYQRYFDAILSKLGQ